MIIFSSPYLLYVPSHQFLPPLPPLTLLSTATLPLSPLLSSSFSHLPSFSLSLRSTIITFQKNADLCIQFEEAQKEVAGNEEHNSKAFAEEFVKQYDDVVQHLLISFQSLRTRIRDLPRTDREAEADAETEKYSLLHLLPLPPFLLS